MNQTKLKQWIDALRSGEYKQTTEQLVNNGCYCALGVACVISDAFRSNELVLGGRGNGFQQRYEPKFIESVYEPGYIEGYETEDVEVELPDIVANEFGITDKRQQEVIEWNDIQKLSFDEIADKLERKYLNV